MKALRTVRWRRRCQAVALSGKGVEGDALRDDVGEEAPLVGEGQGLLAEDVAHAVELGVTL